MLPVAQLKWPTFWKQRMASDKSNETRKAKPANSRSARRRSREFALQGLYQWQLAATPVEIIEKQLSEVGGFNKIDLEYFQTLLRGAINSHANLEKVLTPLLDRRFDELSPIERGVLLLAGFELQQRIDVPYRVVINEAIELAKTFGGVDGHKYVNGILDKLAVEFRKVELGCN